MITTADLKWWLDLEPELDWQFATTYAEWAPHEYVVAARTRGLDDGDLARAAHVIRTFGEPMKFVKSTRIYLVTPMGWKHWDMQGATIEDDSVTIINRGRVEHVYGVQIAPRTRPAAATSFDGFATTWDREFGMTDQEKQLTASLARSTFGDTPGRTLDVGCGTGVSLDLGLAEPTRYTGVDPSAAMLNALVMKHPVLAANHPMTYADAERRRVLGGTIYDTVLAVGGSASYLTSDDILRLRTRAKREVLLMHYEPGRAASDDPVDATVAEDSLRAATSAARSQHRVGRFIASVIPATDAAVV